MHGSKDRGHHIEIGQGPNPSPRAEPQARLDTFAKLYEKLPGYDFLVLAEGKKLESMIANPRKIANNS
jgi:hypothetical protein